MQFDKDSGIIVKNILPIFDVCKREETGKRALDRVLSSIYNDIANAERYMQERVESGCFKTRMLARNEFVVPDIYASRFFPSHISEYVEDKGRWQLTYSCTINDRPVRLFFMLFSEDDTAHLEIYDKYARFMYAWIYICTQYSAKACAKTLDVFLYLTPFKKVIPTSRLETLGPAHVNTAFTWRCDPKGEMVLFREEEWMKVFIHETFHSYGLDPNRMTADKMRTTLKKIFPIESSMDVAEAYTETWARIMNAAFASYASMQKADEGKEQFLTYMKFSLQVERIYAALQVRKILSFMGIPYESLWGDNEADVYMRKNMYREETNVFAYYVLCGILMSDYAGFLEWCRTNNLAFLKYNDSDRSAASLTRFIIKNTSSKSFTECMRSADKILSRSSRSHGFIKDTMRMSAVEMAS
tara:strand:- start:273 stop:1511 length:1239 start_codon:yes stop_codon:yes gene_type:complete